MCYYGSYYGDLGYGYGGLGCGCGCGYGCGYGLYGDYDYRRWCPLCCGRYWSYGFH